MTVKHRDEIEALGLPVLGSVPRLDTHGEDVYLERDTQGIASEAFRKLRTSIGFLNLEVPTRTILVTSALAQEGKTTTSLNLASAYALGGLRTVLVEADLRRPSLHRVFGMVGTRGLTTAIVGDVPLTEAIMHTETRNLSVLVAGAIPPNPVELLGSDQMTDLLERLERMFDIVIVDSPPLVPVADPAALAGRCDGVVIVARAGKTDKRRLVDSARVVERAGGRLLGVVLNFLRSGDTPYEYEYYYGYRAASASTAAGGGRDVTRARVVVLLFVALLFSFGDAVPAIAQSYPPPTNTPRPSRTPKPSPKPDKTPKKTPKKTPEPSCLLVEGEVDGDFAPGRVEYRGDVEMRGGEGCAEPFGDVDFYAESARVFIGATTAAEDGSYRAVRTLPASVMPGEHEIVADIEGRGELRRDITVLPIGSDVQGGPVGGTDDTDGGVLPRTGAGILLLILFALALIGLGSLLAASAWRYRYQLAPVRVFGARFGRKTRRPLALPAPGLQFIDTSRFVPTNTRTTPKPESAHIESNSATLTEWDVAQRNEPQ